MLDELVYANTEVGELDEEVLRQWEPIEGVGLVIEEVLLDCDSVDYDLFKYVIKLYIIY
jgi:hypothetical protein